MTSAGAIGRVFILAPKRKEFGCGISDHTAVLCRGLAASGLTTDIIHYDGRPFRPLPEIGLGDVVFLQLSIYGYSRRGVPVWLPAYLRRTKNLGARLVTFFHELWVSWPRPTSSAFWLAPLQFSICSQVLDLSDLAIFNAEWGYKWAAERGAKHIEYIKTFSNVGEPEQLQEWATRENNLVVFGNPHARSDVYRALASLSCADVAPPCSELTIVDIGEPASAVEEWLKDDGEIRGRFRHVQRHGPLSSGDVSRILGASKFGIFATPWNHAGKSGVMAALLAHGLCPISIHPRNHVRARSQFAPKPDVHFALLHNMNLGTAPHAAIYEGIAKAAHRSYDSSHRLVQLLAGVLQRASPAKAVGQ